MEAGSLIAPIRAAVQCQCGGICESRSISFTLRRSANAFVMFQNVPADVCAQCGEPQFNIAITEQMMIASHTNKTPDGFILVPIYDLAAR
jgi:YgiT-type zinc finger domain-containing protein